MHAVALVFVPPLPDGDADAAALAAGELVDVDVVADALGDAAVDALAAAEVVAEADADGEDTAAGLPVLRGELPALPHAAAKRMTARDVGANRTFLMFAVGRKAHAIRTSVRTTLERGRTRSRYSTNAIQAGQRFAMSIESRCTRPPTEASGASALPVPAVVSVASMTMRTTSSTAVTAL